MECIIFYKNQLLVSVNSDQDNKTTLPNITDIQSLRPDLNTIYATETEFVATLEHPPHQATPATPQEGNSGHHPHLDEKNNLQLIGLRLVLNHFDMPMISRIIYYYQLQHYYQRNKFCGSCGNSTIRNGHNKFITCNNCQHEIYPHIAPCIIVRIHKGDQILMARGVNFLPNSWGLIAGFVEINECLEDAVIREVKEEVGIEIDNIKYWGSQPWPFPTNAILVCFTADYKSGEIKPDTTEIAEAGFFTTDTIPGKPSTNYSITSKMIEEWELGFTQITF